MALESVASRPSRARVSGGNTRLKGGYWGDVLQLPTPASGSTVTLNAGLGQCVRIPVVNAFTLNPPVIPPGTYTYMRVILVNDAGGGNTITTSNFSAVSGTYATTGSKIYTGDVFVDNTTGTPYSTLTYSGPR